MVADCSGSAKIIAMPVDFTGPFYGPDAVDQCVKIDFTKLRQRRGCCPCCAPVDASKIKVEISGTLPDGSVCCQQPPES
jgi:hypothetical protein